jgi:sortase A
VIVKLLERALLVVGLACVGYYALAMADAAYNEQEVRAAVEAALATPETPVENPAMGTNLIGLLEIPRLNLSTAVVEGDSGEALNGTAGHLPDTPRPWEKGNSAIAAHRDQQFRALKNIRIGDELRVQTPHGEMLYQVTDTHIVMPTDLSVLKAKSEQMLTLITCYPFNYIGSAPKRFIVHASRVTPQQLAQASAKAQAPRPARTAAGGRTRGAAATGSAPSAASRPRPKATKSTPAGSLAASRDRRAAPR